MRKAIGILVILLLVLPLIARGGDEEKKEKPKPPEVPEVPELPKVPKMPKVPKKLKRPRVPEKLLDERKRAFIIAGGGYTFNRIEGLNYEVGAEVRLFRSIHLRLTWDYYDNAYNFVKDSTHVNNAAGINLYIVPKIRLSNTAKFYFQFGAMYSRVSSTIVADVAGSPYTFSEYAYGGIGGIGFQFQVSNRWYLYFSGCAKYVKTSDPWAWFRAGAGLMFRIR